MLPARGCRRGGFSLLELVTVIVVVGVLMALFLDRVLYYQEYSEKTAMELTVMNVRSALRLKTAELVLDGRTGEIAELAGQNPVKWLERAPPNYVGERDDPPAGEIAPGNWYFDRARHELVYRLDRAGHFAEEGDGARVRYRVEGVTEPAGTGGGAGSGRVEWARLALVRPYHWF